MESNGEYFKELLAQAIFGCYENKLRKFDEKSRLTFPG
jgi:hypothetical protein